jgi:hypothetical protein
MYGGVVVVMHFYVGTVSRAQLWTSIKTLNFVTFYKFLPHIGLHHTVDKTQEQQAKRGNVCPNRRKQLEGQCDMPQLQEEEANHMGVPGRRRNGREEDPARVGVYFFSAPSLPSQALMTMSVER